MNKNNKPDYCLLNEQEVQIGGETYYCNQTYKENGYEWRETSYLGEFPYSSYQYVVGTLGRFIFLKKFETEINPRGKTDKQIWFAEWTRLVSDPKAPELAEIPDSWKEYACTFSFREQE